VKATWILVCVLLVSVGLNAGLAIRLARRGPAADGPPPGWSQPRPPAGESETPPDPADPRTRRLMHERLERLSAALELTPQQLEAFVAVHEATAPLFFANRSAVGKLRRELRDLALSPTVDHAEVLARQQRLSTLQAQLDSVVVETMLAEVRLLTPEQKERYRTIMPWGEQGQRGPGHRGGGRRSSPQSPPDP
jgi:Spy/CpxP family protein refolding chaperone